MAIVQLGSPLAVFYSSLALTVVGIDKQELTQDLYAFSIYQVCLGGSTPASGASGNP